ncbi:post-transcriptional regulator [Metabacillus fastidiosus]|uniref:post-transcriptional regulator n=1 Tax=Metabacillus fastidiosus TaxID=1458 RepID=UPI002E23BC98|nr:post-transcriptional regulator [Metabacillus fastidiosus]
MDRQPVEKFKHAAKPAITSKLEEFRILGYEDMTEEKLWDFLKNKKWKKLDGVLIHEVVSDILSVKISDFMNYATIESYKDTNWFESAEGEDILKNLL